MDLGHTIQSIDMHIMKMSECVCWAGWTIAHWKRKQSVDFKFEKNKKKWKIPNQKQCSQKQSTNIIIVKTTNF